MFGGLLMRRSLLRWMVVGVLRKLMLRDVL
jgi:hypothetical protein